MNTQRAVVNPVALDYIRYLSNAIKPLKLPEFVTKQSFSQDDKKALNSLSSKEYLVQLRNYQAIASAANNAVWRSYYERLPTIPVTNAMKDQKVPSYPVGGDDKTSIHALEEHMATWRLKNPEWFKHMQQALPPMVERELLRTATERLYETYQLRRSIEQLNLTMSSMLFLLTDNKRSQLENSPDAVVKQYTEQYSSTNH